MSLEKEKIIFGRGCLCFVDFIATLTVFVVVAVAFSDKGVDLARKDSAYIAVTWTCVRFIFLSLARVEET